MGHHKDNDDLREDRFAQEERREERRDDGAEDRESQDKRRHEGDRSV